jgi:hypothetical protein
MSCKEDEDTSGELIADNDSPDTLIVSETEICVFETAHISRVPAVREEWESAKSVNTSTSGLANVSSKSQRKRTVECSSVHAVPLERGNGSTQPLVRLKCPKS